MFKTVIAVEKSVFDEITSAKKIMSAAEKNSPLWESVHFIPLSDFQSYLEGGAGGAASLCIALFGLLDSKEEYDGAVEYMRL